MKTVRETSRDRIQMMMKVTTRVMKILIPNKSVKEQSGRLNGLQ